MSCRIWRRRRFAVQPTVIFCAPFFYLWTKKLYTIKIFLSTLCLDNMFVLCIIWNVLFPIHLHHKRGVLWVPRNPRKTASHVDSPSVTAETSTETAIARRRRSRADNHKARKTKARNKARATAPEDIKRGAPVAGIHKKAASSPGTSKKKA